MSYIIKLVRQYGNLEALATHADNMGREKACSEYSERANAKLAVIEKTIADIASLFERIKSESSAMGADLCPPAPHACSKCEILFVANEGLEKVGA